MNLRSQFFACADAFMVVARSFNEAEDSHDLQAMSFLKRIEHRLADRTDALNREIEEAL